jgi:ADP-dependent NAD(P)H-hydrate dehydratase
MMTHRLLTEPPPMLPPRDPRGHKGTFGTVLVCGGCAANPRMIGAPALAAMASLRAGCGLAKVLAPAPILDHVLTLCPSATGWGVELDEHQRLMPHEASRGFDAIAPQAHSIVVGPGLGEGPGVSRLALRAIQHEGCPVILDADAINALATIPELHRDWRCAGVITPHPGEFRRLAAWLNIEADAVSEATRPSAAEELAQKLGCIVVLKGAGTVVSDGHQTWVNATGGPELATAGTGDVLAGLIAGLVAQHGERRGEAGGGNASAEAQHQSAMNAARVLALAKMRERGLPMPATTPQTLGSISGAARAPAAKPLPISLFDLVRIAVMIHGRAGERWREQQRARGGMVAMELAHGLPAVVGEWQENSHER